LNQMDGTNAEETQLTLRSLSPTDSMYSATEGSSAIPRSPSQPSNTNSTESSTPTSILDGIGWDQDFEDAADEDGSVQHKGTEQSPTPGSEVQLFSDHAELPGTPPPPITSSAHLTTQRLPIHSPDHIGRAIAERDNARAISEGLIPDDGAGIFPDGPTRLRLCNARLQRIADECALIKSLEAATTQQAEGDKHDTQMARATKPIPQRLPPTQPMQTPWGRWYVTGYEADGRERLTYQPHTHTPITKPQMRRTHGNPGTHANLDGSPQLKTNESHEMENPATGLASAERITARRRSIHTRPYAQPHPPKQQQVDAINELTTNVDERRIPTSKEPTNRHASRTACDRHTTPPACTPTRHSQSPGVCSRRSQRQRS
jgi:hypothetical protein